MTVDNPQDAVPPAVPIITSLSLPIAVLGDLPARARFHHSQDTAARAMESLLAPSIHMAAGESMSAP
jgi:hypothetical protein